MWTSLLFNILWGAATIMLTYIMLQKASGATGLALSILLAYTVKMVCMGIYLLTINTYHNAKV
jgi:hypothetical protein